MPVRLLLLADTHLGFDLPTRPRIQRRRRGHDFQANFEQALAPALNREVDLVVHGGDVFHRSRVPPSLVYQAFEPLKRVADAGVPVFLVPGNHERGRIPHPRLYAHPGIHVFDRPRSFVHDVNGVRVRLFGFPYQRKVRDGFPALVRDLGVQDAGADIALLCLHHCVQGSQVEGYTFRGAPDVIRTRDIPGRVAAVLTGHIHRHQVLERDLAGRPLAAPVFYPGSVERTSFAERAEPKGYIRMELDSCGGSAGGAVAAWRFVELPARPMVTGELDVDTQGPAELARGIDRIVAGSPTDAIVRLRVRGRVPPPARPLFAAARLRSRIPSSMNLDVVFPDEPRRAGKPRTGITEARTAQATTLTTA